jgi:LytS/YehU family sensor histidine kinase
LPDEAAVDQIRVPALTLQPLIENAVRHGISKRIDGGTVSVRVHKEGEMFSLTVENDVDAASVHPEGEFFKTDHALENVRRRLRFYYPRRAEHAPTLLHPRRAVERIPPGSIQVTFPRPDAVAVTITASRISIYDKALRAMSDR